MEDREARERVRALMETRPSHRPPDFVNPLEKIEQLLTCPICLDRYKVPKLLPCQHTFCLPCLEGCAESAGRLLKCPECRAEHTIPYEGVKAFQTNYTLTGFLDIHLQATNESSAQIEEYIHRYNLERCKICDEKAECEQCAHCERKACAECRKSHMEMLKRDLGRLLNQVKRLSNRITEASDGVSKGIELMTLNCETTKTEVKEYFHRYSRELKKREDHLMSEIEQFQNNENRLMSNLRDVLELESSNMSEAVARLDAALKGECTIEDADFVKYKNTFTEGLEYLRNFQPDADELFCKKLRFAPGDDAAKLPQAISSFGELAVLVPQFSGRYLPLENSYLPRPFRVGLESDLYKGSSRRDRDTTKDDDRRSGYSTRDADEESSLRYKRRHALENEAWNRLHSSPGVSQSPWSRSPLPETLAPEPSNTRPNSPARGSYAGSHAAPSAGSYAAPAPPAPAVVTKPPVPTTTFTAASRTPVVSASMTSSSAPSTSASSAMNGVRRNAPAPLASCAKPPLPRQRSSTDDTSLNEKIETIRRAHEKRVSSVMPIASGESSAAESSENESPAEEMAIPAPPSPSASATSRSRIRIICRASSVTRTDELPSALSVPSSTGASSTGDDEEPPPSPIPIQHYPGDREPPPEHRFFSRDVGARASMDERARVSIDDRGARDMARSIDDESPPTTPAWLARRRARFARSKTNPDLAAAFGLTAGASPRVQQLLQARRTGSRLDTSTTVRAGASPSAVYNEDGELVTPPESPRGRSRQRRPSLTREAAEYRKIPTKVIGRKGGKEGELNWPRGLAALPGGLLAVADSSNHRVCVFAAIDGRFVRAFGEYGAGKGQLDSCAGVAATGRTRHIVVTDRYNHRVVVYDNEGEVVTSWGGHGPNNGRFNNPWGVAVDDSGTVYVVDKDNHRVQMFDKSGNFLGKFGTMGHADGQLNTPLFLAVSRLGHDVYVTDSCNSRVCVFDANGCYKFSFGEEGFQAGQFKQPRGIAIDQKGNVIVADSGNNRVQVFTPDGDFISTFGSWGSGAGQLKGVEAVTVLNDGSIVVSDRDNHRIQIFN